MAGGQSKDAAASACARAFAVGDAGNGARRIFAFQRSRAQQSWVRVEAVIAIKIRNIARQQTVLRRKARILVLWRFFRHVDGTRH